MPSMASAILLMSSIWSYQHYDSPVKVTYEYHQLTSILSVYPHYLDTKALFRFQKKIFFKFQIFVWTHENYFSWFIWVSEKKFVKFWENDFPFSKTIRKNIFSYFVSYLQNYEKRLKFSWKNIFQKIFFFSKQTEPNIPI